MFALQIVAIWLPMLKHQLIRVLVDVLLCKSQISIQMIDISDLGETLIIHSLEAILILLKMWVDLIIKFTNSGLSFSFIFHFYFYFIFSLFSYFSIFRTARVRVDWSCCHNSHLIAKSQDRSQDLGEFSRRFENRWRHTTWTLHVSLIDYTWLFRVGCTVVSMDHL